MSEQFHVRLRKATHVFCAGHFITLTDQICEPVHGHNWTVGVDVVGSPDAHGMVIDFIALRNLLSDILAQLDHRMLLPTLNRFLKLVTRPASADTMSGSEVEVQFTDREGIFSIEFNVQSEAQRIPAVARDSCAYSVTVKRAAEWIDIELKVSRKLMVLSAD